MNENFTIQLWVMAKYFQVPFSKLVHFKHLNCHYNFHGSFKHVRWENRFTEQTANCLKRKYWCQKEIIFFLNCKILLSKVKLIKLMQEEAVLVVYIPEKKERDFHPWKKSLPFCTTKGKTWCWNIKLISQVLCSESPKTLK